MDPRHSRYCPRCEDLVPVVAPWPHWGLAWRAYLAGLVVLLLSLVFIIWEPCLTPPMVMTYLAAGGVMWRLARTKPVCRRCSLELEPGQRGGTGVRIKAFRTGADVPPGGERKGLVARLRRWTRRG